MSSPVTSDPVPVYPPLLAQGVGGSGPRDAPDDAPGPDDAIGPDDAPRPDDASAEPSSETRRRLVLVLVVLGVAGVVFALLVVALVRGLSGLGSSVHGGSATDVGWEAQGDPITERPGWDPLVAHGQELSDTYLAMVDDGTIYELVPRTQEGLNYVHDFLLLLADENGALKFMTTTSDDPAELDATIQERWDRFDELERIFLAGEDFDVDISITDSDGTTYTSDGLNHWDDAP
ncbi:hypothetical protein [Cellulomonas soli]|nr:hypothetical protein [Cellulomonas soli]NYI59113.1 hypothetical protein [Cellulomonas soli]